MISKDHRCSRCGETTLRRQGSHGEKALCPQCALAMRGEYEPPRVFVERPRSSAGTFIAQPPVKPEPRLVIVETKIDTSRYVPGTPPSPFMLEQLYREARRATPGYQGVIDDVVGRQGYLRRVSERFHQRLRELGIPMEGA